MDPSVVISLTWDAITLPNHPILSWIANEGKKSNRSSKSQWVLHTQPSWSQTVLEEHPQDLGPRILEAVERLLNQKLEVLQYQVHRWRYSQVKKPSDQGSWFLPEQHIGMCGDWLHGGNLEGAYLSGTHLAGTVLHHYNKNAEKK